MDPMEHISLCLSCEYCEDNDEALYCLAETCIKGQDDE